MEYVVLGLLIYQSATLYELNQAFKQGISTFYSASYGALQAAVKNLLGKGWIVFEEKVERGRNKKVYSITGAGREAFEEWMFAELPENRLEVTILSKLFFLDLVEGGGARKRVLEEMAAKIEAAQNRLVEMDEALNRLGLAPEEKRRYKYQLKTLEYGIESFAFARGWFQSLLDELEGEEGA